MEQPDRPALAQDARTEWKRVLLQYTGCFALTSVLVFFWFSVEGKTFVWAYDGIKQHYRAQVFFGQYFRAALRSLFSGKGLLLPQWSYALGEGGDVLTALHYYSFGDPFSLGAVLVPEHWMFLYYGLTSLLRMYCAGLAFLYLCRETGQKSGIGLTAGALVYVFCMWGLYTVYRHPFFVNPMICLPLLILGIERVLRGRGPVVLILSTFAAAISNFYFLYMHAILGASYVLLRLIPLLRQDRRWVLRRFAALAGAGLLGTVMAAVVLLPVTAAFLGDVRKGADHVRRLFYPLSYYLKLPHLLLNTEAPYWLCLGFSAPILIPLLLLPRRRERRFLLLLLGFCGIILLFPELGRALNGFSYIANRWSWAVALAAAYIFVDSWDGMMELSPRDARYCAWALGGYAALCMACYDKYRFKTLGPLLIAALFLLLLWPRKGQGRLVRRFGKPALAVSGIILSIFYNAAAVYAPFFWNYPGECLTVEEVFERMEENETGAIRAAAGAAGDEDFYRYSGRELTENAGLNAGISSTQYYFSLSNPWINEAREVFGVLQERTSQCMGYDDRAALLALTGVRYYARTDHDGQEVPYGYSSTGVSVAGNTIFRSENALPLGCVYDSWITQRELEPYTFTERQELMLHTVITDAPVEELPHWEGELETQRLSAELIRNDPDAVVLEDCFVVTKEDAEVVFRLPGLTAGETLFEIRGLEFEPVMEYQLYFGEDKWDPLGRYGQTEWDALSQKEQASIRRNWRYSSAPMGTKLTLTTDRGAETSFKCFTPEYNFYNGRRDFAVNLLQSHMPVNTVRLRFGKRGVYHFDSITFCVQPMESLAERTEALRSSTLEELRLEADRISGRITLDETRLLCLSVPWSSGWTAEVDGAPAELLHANVKNMGLLLGPGTHVITLRYERPMGKPGWILSLCAWLVFLCLICVRRYLRNRKNRGIVEETN